MDASRALLAGVVALGHAWLLLVEDYRGERGLAAGLGYWLAGFGHQAVVLFFVLSGYWISRSVVTRARRGWSWPDYLVDRLSRLMIVLVPGLAIGGALDWLAISLGSTTHLGLTNTWVLRQDVTHDLSLPVLIGNLLFLQHIIVPVYGSNGPLWSLAFEFWYYLWFPALGLSLVRRRPSPALLTLGLAFLNPQLAVGFVAWLCGALVWFAEERAPRGAMPGWALAATGALCLATIAWCRSFDHPLEDPLLGASFALFLFVLLRREPRMLPGVGAFARFGAGSSFSLYAMHFPILAFVAGMVVVDRRLAPDANGWLASLAAFALAVAASWLLSRQTEAHTGELRLALRRRLRLQ